MYPDPTAPPPRPDGTPGGPPPQQQPPQPPTQTQPTQQNPPYPPPQQPPAAGAPQPPTWAAQQPPTWGAAGQPPAWGGQQQPAWDGQQQPPAWDGQQQPAWGGQQQPSTAWTAPSYPSGTPPPTVPLDQAPTWGAPLPPPRPSNGLARTGKIILMRVGIAAVVIAVVAVFAVVRGGDSHTGVQTYPTSSPPSGQFATSTAHANPNAPFDDTPSATYPEGASGLTMPAATAVSKFTKQQVADALTQVRNALVAARLDSKMIVNRDPATFLALISSGEREDLRTDFGSDRFSTYATQVAPGHQLSTAQPRVKGRTTFRASTNSNGVHELQIVTNYVWVYAFTAPAGGDPGDNLVVIHDDVTWSVPSTSEVSKSDRGLWMDDSESYGSNVDCTLFDKGLIAPGTPQLDLGGSGSSEDPDSMFDPDRSLDIANTC